MKQRFWTWLAAFIVRHPFIVEWIIRNAQSKPYFHLDGYMHRWWLTPSWMLGVDKNGDPFPYEWVPMIFKARVHHILRADKDRHKHDHPADNRSIVLKKEYDEEDVFDNVKTVKAGQTVLRRAETFHRIVWVPDGGVWTIWFMAEKRNDWGFLVDGRKVYYKTYFALGLGESV